MESYYDDNMKYKDLFDEFNNKLREYHHMADKNENDQELIIYKLIATFEKIGVENFVIYDDGCVEYTYKNVKKGDINIVK